MEPTMGVKSVTCHCGSVMKTTGGNFGGAIYTLTYYCSKCRYHVIVVLPNKEKQRDFAERMERK